MPVLETQIKMYALTKEIMDLSQKYVSSILLSEKTVLFAEINQLYERLNDLQSELKNEKNKNVGY